MTPRLPDPADSRAVLIGCANYRTLDDLPTVTKGLKDVSNALADSVNGGFTPESLTLLTDTSSPAAVVERLQRKAREARDTFLVYFSGHGLLNNRNDLHLALQNTNHDNLTHTALAYEQVREALLGSPARNKIVILDCCFAGRAIQAMADPDGVVAGQTAIEGSYILTASAATKTAVATDGNGHTAFTGALLHTLRTGITDGPELLTLAELFPRLQATLRARNHPTPRQQGSDTVTGLALTRNPSHRVIDITTTRIRERSGGRGCQPRQPRGHPPRSPDLPDSPTRAPALVRPMDTVPTAVPGYPRPDLEGSVSAAGGSTVGGSPGGGGQDPRPRRRRILIGVALAVTAMVGVLISLQLKGAPPVQRCQGVPVQGAMSAVFSGGDGNCYGYTDTADPGAGFGDRLARTVQSEIFARNRPVAAGDLTVIWFGSLTCPPGESYKIDGTTCSGGREYDSERQELQALKLAQHRDDLGGHVHVVIANAGADMTRAEQVTRLIADHRDDFGPRIVVIGGGDSRQVTKNAITTLLGAHIPFIAPTMSADLDTPGRPFIDRPGFLQMSPPNRAWAVTAISFIAEHTLATAHRKVIIYHVPVAGDEYTESLALDALQAARDNPRIAETPEIVNNVSGLPPSVCRSTRSGGPPPTALFFADRWTSFGTFANSLTALCGRTGPALLVSSDSVNRFMINDEARKLVNAPWPMAYYRIGKQCAELETATDQFPLSESAALLTAARTDLSLCAPGTNPLQIGDRLPVFWDAATVATKITSADDDSGIVNDADLTGATGTLTVRNGQIASTTGTLQPLCVFTVDRTRNDGRSAANCDTAFGTPTGR